jgi:predicted lactoylglutathione lyase
MQLGAFSISLAVKDLATSRTFYEALGFTRTGGDGEHYLIMVNDTTVIWLFQGMFEENILTFNPGLGQDKAALSSFMDVREIQARLLEAGLELTQDTDAEGTGPAHITLMDPDGNPILIDQFAPKPAG